MSDTKLTKAEVIALISERTGATKSATADTLDAIEAVLTTALQDGKVIPLLGGTFRVSERAARDGINPQTKEAIKIEASKGVNFKAGSALKADLN